MFHSLRAKLVASYGIVIFLCLFLAGSAFVYLLRDYQRQIKLNQVAELALPISWQVRLLEQAGASQDQLSAFLRDRAAEQDIRVLLLDPSGTVVDDTGGNLKGQHILMADGAHVQRSGPSEADSVMIIQQDEGLVLISVRGTRRAPPSTDRFVPRVSNYSVVLAVPEQSLTASWLELAPSLSFAALVSLFVSIAVAFLLSRSISKPIVAITRASEEMARGNYAQHISVSGKDEVARLGDAFNHMAHEVSVSHRTLRDFLANVSHELRTPLTSIQGFSQAIVDGTASSPQDLLEAGEIINEESGRMRRLVEDLLLLSKIESGQMPMNSETLDLRELLRMCVRRVGAQAQQAGTSLVLSADEPASVVGDEGRLEELFRNLLDNALRHTPPGGQIDVHLAIPRSTEPAPNGKAAHEPLARTYEVSVHNTGSYIPPEDQERIFERFYQVDKARTRNGDGSGLGLAIASEIAHVHGGSISLHSNETDGTTFVVTLPAKHPPASNPKGRSGGREQPPEADSQQPRKI